MVSGTLFFEKKNQVKLQRGRPRCFFLFTSQGEFILSKKSDVLHKNLANDCI